MGGRGGGGPPQRQATAGAHGHGLAIGRSRQVQHTARFEQARAGHRAQASQHQVGRGVELLQVEAHGTGRGRQVEGIGGHQHLRTLRAHQHGVAAGANGEYLRGWQARQQVLPQLGRPHRVGRGLSERVCWRGG